jgi:hypothetical protein
MSRRAGAPPGGNRTIANDERKVEPVSRAYLPWVVSSWDNTFPWAALAWQHRGSAREGADESLESHVGVHSLTQNLHSQRQLLRISHVRKFLNRLRRSFSSALLMMRSSSGGISRLKRIAGADRNRDNRSRGVHFIGRRTNVSRS